MGNATPLPSASILIVRDTPKGMEILMMQRSKGLSFAAGAMVFPGGKVDADDMNLGPWSRALGRGHDMPDVRHRLAAIREMAEETGLLLATPRGGGVLPPWLARQIADKCHESAAALRKALRYNRTVLRPDQMVPFAHWVTPEGMPKRFDTYFYLAKAPAFQSENLIEGEAVDLTWERPDELLETAEDRGIDLWFPTRLNLMKLAQSHSVADAIGHAHKHPPVRIQPKVGKRDSLIELQLLEKAGYPRFSPDEMRRFIPKGG